MVLFCLLTHYINSFKNLRHFKCKKLYSKSMVLYFWPHLALIFVLLAPLRYLQTYIWLIKYMLGIIWFTLLTCQFMYEVAALQLGIGLKINGFVFLIYILAFGHFSLSDFLLYWFFIVKFILVYFTSLKNEETKIAI